MDIFKKTHLPELILIFLILTPHVLRGQEVHSYDLDVSINMENKSIHVDGYLEIDFKNKDSLNFTLCKNTRIERIEMNHIPCDYRFDSIGDSPNFFVPNGKNLTVNRPLEAVGQNHNIHFTYTSDMSFLGKGWEGVFSEEWLELAFYSGWYPNLDGNYTAKLRVYIDEDYKVTGSGTASKKEAFWELDKSWPSFDIVLMASRDLKSKVYSDNEIEIQLDYTDLSEAGSDSTMNDGKFAFNLFKGAYGMLDHAYQKIVIGPYKEGGGYSRKHFICMPANKYSQRLSFGNAHEIAHFWWTNAPSHSWEDWLNEAFAQYSALLFIRERFGGSAFDRLINNYKEETVGSPPVWGVDRQAPEAYNVLYLKGSIILSELEQKLGEDLFIDLMNMIYQKRIGATEDLLKLIRTEVSEEISDWLENKLKTA